MEKGDRDKPVTTDSNVEITDPASLELIAIYALEHYLKHRSVVLRKLEHARHATAQSIQKIGRGAANGRQEYEEVSSYEHVWDQIIEMFRSGGMSEAELAEIEKVLISMPGAIRAIYELLVRQDAALQVLIAELQSEHYIHALAYTRKVQNRRNPMSGLSAEYYDRAVNDHAVSAVQDVIFYRRQRRQ